MKFMLVLMIAISGCKSLSSASDVKAIHSLVAPGESDSPYFVKVYAGGSLCTGTMISPDLLLTAHHCVYDHEDKASKGWKPRQVEVGTSHSDSVSPAAKIYPSPDGGFADPQCQDVDFSESDRSTQKCDVALVRLQSSITPRKRIYPSVSSKRPPLYQCFSTFSFGASSRMSRRVGNAELQCGFNHIAKSTGPGLLATDMFSNLSQTSRRLPNGMGVGHARGDSGTAVLVYNPAFQTTSDVGAFVIAGVIIKPEALDASKEKILMVDLTSGTSMTFLANVWKDLPKASRFEVSHQPIEAIRRSGEADDPIYFWKAKGIVQESIFKLKSSYFPVREDRTNLFSSTVDLIDVNGFKVKSTRELGSVLMGSCPFLHYFQRAGENSGKSVLVKLTDRPERIGIQGSGLFVQQFAELCQGMDPDTVIKNFQ